MARPPFFCLTMKKAKKPHIIILQQMTCSFYFFNRKAESSGDLNFVVAQTILVNHGKVLLPLLRTYFTYVQNIKKPLYWVNNKYSFFLIISLTLHDTLSRPCNAGPSGLSVIFFLTLCLIAFLNITI